MTNDFDSCALLGSGAVRCWGDNRIGLLMNPAVSGNSSVAVSVQGIGHVIAISASVYHGCTVADDGSEGCWPPYVTAMTGAATDGPSVATGNAHSCELVPGGRVQCQGATFHGELGDGTNDFSEHGVLVSGLTDAVMLTAGMEFSCALRAGGGVACWGEGSFGQLGGGASTSSNVPVAVSGLANATAISAYRFSACAVEAGSVKCWGANDTGQLGDGTTSALEPAGRRAHGHDVAHTGLHVRGRRARSCNSR